MPYFVCVCLQGVRSTDLVHVVQLGAWPPPVVRLLPQPLGANFDPAAARLAAARPVGPLAQLTVRGAGDDAGLLDVA